MVRGFISTSWTFVFHSAEDKITRGHSWKLITIVAATCTRLQFFSQPVTNRWKSLRKIFLCHQWTLLNIVSRKKIVRRTSLTTHGLPVLLAAQVRKSDGFRQDGSKDIAGCSRTRWVIAAAADWMTVPVYRVWLSHNMATRQSFHDSSDFHDCAPYLVLTIVRKNVCNKAKKRKLTFLDFEKNVK